MKINLLGMEKMAYSYILYIQRLPLKNVKVYHINEYIFTCISACIAIKFHKMSDRFNKNYNYIFI